jgi:hypothetical protein
VFNGDYIDRGENSVEVLLTLLLIKLAYRDNVILIRGNHECAGVASVYGFYDELRAKLETIRSTLGLAFQHVFCSFDLHQDGYCLYPPWWYSEGKLLSP